MLNNSLTEALENKTDFNFIFVRFTEMLAVPRKIVYFSKKVLISKPGVFIKNSSLSRAHVSKVVA